MPENGRGEIMYGSRARQLILFHGLRWGKITPTDVDAFLNFDGSAFVFVEAKGTGVVMQRGQEMAFEMVCEAIEAAGRRALVLQVEHTTSVYEDVELAACSVVRFWLRREWVSPKHEWTTRTFIDRWLEFVGIDPARVGQPGFPF